MKPLLACLGLTFGLLLLTAALFGSPGAAYLVTTAGLPHFILGFVFAGLSVLHGRPERRRILLALGAVSVAACLLYARFPVFDLVTAYFVIHMFRDEVYMDLSRRARFDARAVAAAGSGAGGAGAEAGLLPHELSRAWLAGRVFMLVALAAFLLARVSVSQRQPMAGDLFADAAVHLTGSVSLDLAIGAGVALLLGLLALAPRRGFAALHLPLEARDFLALFLIVAFAGHLRQATLFLALFHYVSWYLFYGEKLAARERAAGDQAAPGPASFWRRAMTRPRAFTGLMLAGNALAVAGLLLYLWRPEQLWPLAAGYEYAYFPYWTIPHVTLSFVPRR